MIENNKEQLEKQKIIVLNAIAERYIQLLASIEKKFSDFEASLEEKPFDDVLKSMINVNKFMSELPAVFDKIFISETLSKSTDSGFLVDKLSEAERNAIGKILANSVKKVSQ